MENRALAVAIVVSLVLVISVLTYVSPGSMTAYAVYAGDSSAPEIDLAVEQQAEVNGSARVIVTVKDKPVRTGWFSVADAGSKEAREKMKEEVIEKLDKENIRVRHKDTSKTSLSAEVTKEDLDKLKEDKDIEGVALVPKISAFLDVSVPYIDANDTWVKQRGGANVTGDGTTVCVIDSGVDTDHSNLPGYLGGYDYVNDDADPADDNGHGMHVAGIVASNHSTYGGVAPEAGIVAIKVLNSAGNGGLDDVKSAIDWCVNNASTYNISVITMSLGTDTLNSSVCDSSYGPGDAVDLVSSVNSAIANNISVFAATGNDDSTTKIASPACIENVTAVTSVKHNSDDVPSYANRNDLVELAAPGGTSGDKIVSLSYTGGTTSKHGTSMATPHVAGAAALLYSASELSDLSKTPSQVFTSLNSTGADVDDTGNSGEHFQRVNVLDAYYDFVPPSFNLEFPTNGSYYNYNIAWLNFTTDRALSLANVSLDGGANFTMSNDTLIHYYNSTSVTSEGWHNASYYINSSWDDNEEIVKFYVDKTNPNKPTNLNNQTPGDNEINWTWTDPTDGESGLDYIKIFRNGTWIGNASAGQQSYLTNCLNASTTYNITLNSVDKASNVNTTAVSKTASTAADSSGPSISISTPSAGNTYSSSTITYSISLDEHSQLDACLASTDSGSNQTMTLSSNTCNSSATAAQAYSPSASLSSGSLSDGSHSVTFYCNDTEGNPSSTTVSFSVSTTSSGSPGGSSSSTTDDEEEEEEETEEEVSFGSESSFSAGESGTFSYAGGSHTITIESINSKVKIKIASEPIEFYLSEGESKEVDLDGDGTNDIKVTLNSVVGETAYIVVEEIDKFAAASGDEIKDKKPESSEAFWYWVAGAIVLACLAVGFFVARSKGLFKRSE